MFAATNRKNTPARKSRGVLLYIILSMAVTVAKFPKNQGNAKQACAARNAYKPEKAGAPPFENTFVNNREAGS